MLRREPGSKKVVQFRFGVLELGLGLGGWNWQYRTADGSARDAGSAHCR